MLAGSNEHWAYMAGDPRYNWTLREEPPMDEQPQLSRLDCANAVIEESNADPLLAAKVRGLMVGYDAKWANQQWNVVSVEEQFLLPIVNPESLRQSRTYKHAGKVDGIIELNDRTYLLEHKTCSEDITRPDAPYWRRLTIDAQVSGYVLAYWQMGRKLDGTMYDVIRKPGIRPKQLTKAEMTSALMHDTHYGQPVSREDKRRLISDNIESPAMFSARLAADTLERPDWYFQRRSVPRLDQELADYSLELWETADEIRLAKASGRHFRNPGACMNYGTPCKFLGICSGHEDIDGGRWGRKTNVHSELNLNGNGLDVLTNTSMQMFKTCRRKFHYEYELGLQREDAEDSEALVFGDLMHRALAAWWLMPDSVPLEVA